MKVDSIFGIQCTDSGYDVTIRTSTGNYAVAHCNEDFVIQQVSRVEKKVDNGFEIVEQYSVIPQECRVAISRVRNDDEILNDLLMNGYWSNSAVVNQ